MDGYTPKHNCDPCAGWKWFRGGVGVVLKETTDKTTIESNFGGKDGNW
jgi:hypothetical protein